MYLRGALILLLGLICVSCHGGDGAPADNDTRGAIEPDEVNRYELEFTGAITMTHTGGLVCAVEDGAMTMDFSIDASDGVYEYEATIPAFDPTVSGFDANFAMTASGEQSASGTVQVTFGYGPAPDEYPGVVRAAGSISGTLDTPDGQAEISGTYACFLQNSAVGA